jgi:type VI secretion system protein ImpC
MSRREWDAEVQLSSNPEAADQPVPEEHDPDRKLVIGVMADFHGPMAASGPPVPLGKRKFFDVDRDNFDGVLARLGVCWRGRLRSVPGEAAPDIPVELVFRELDDFHPDRIVERTPVLCALRELLTDLDDPGRFEEAAAKVSHWPGFGEEPPAAPRPVPAPGSAPPASRPADSGQLLDAILNQQEVPRSQPSDIDRLVREIVEPHQLRVDTRRQEAITAAMNRALTIQVNSVLHDPAFRSLESLWRSLRRLVDAAGPETTVRIVQVRKDELLADVTSGRSLQTSGLAGLLLDPMSVPGTARFSLLVGGFEFSHDLEDLAVLERLGNIGAGLRAPIVAGASAKLFGCKSFTELPEAAEMERLLDGEDYRPWRLLRQTRPARWVALAAPRLLCRLPYGLQTDPAGSFEFEEWDAGQDHEQYLWGNPAFAIAAIFAGAFAEAGWQMDPARSVTRLEGLPLHVYRGDGESVTKPCAEILMGEQTLEALMDAGVLPLVSYRDADIVSFPSLQTLAHPRAPLRL